MLAGIPDALADGILWVTAPLRGYLTRLSMARGQAWFGIRGPLTWRELNPLYRDPAVLWESAEQGARHEH